MSKGKYAEKAANRRAELEANANISAYQNRVAKLTAENRELKQRAIGQQTAHSRDVKRLRAERDQGLSPEIALLQQEVRLAKEEAERARRDREATLRRWHALTSNLLRGLDELGLSPRDAQRFAVAVIADRALDETPIVSNDGNLRFAKDKTAVNRIALARGEAR